MDVRKALRRFAGFFEGKVGNHQRPAAQRRAVAASPFLEFPFFRETRDGRHVVALDFYPQLRARTLSFLRCSENIESIKNAILKWKAEELEDAAAEAGTRAGDGPHERGIPPRTSVHGGPLEDAADHGGEDRRQRSGAAQAERRSSARWHPRLRNGPRHRGRRDGPRPCAVRRGRPEYLEAARSELEAFAWDVQVGMRSTILGDSKDDRAQFQRLLKRADVFFANKRPGFLSRHGLDAEELRAQKPGLIHATVVLHGEKGPWSNRPGFDEIGAAVSGVFTLEGTPTRPKQPPIVPIADNVVGWLGTTGILAALRRRAIEGGSYRVVVSLTRTVLWLLSLGIFDQAYAQATAGSTDEHRYAEPDLFTAETPCGSYQGMTDQVVLSRTPGAFRTVLVPRGSSKPEWFTRYELDDPAQVVSARFSVRRTCRDPRRNRNRIVWTRLNPKSHQMENQSCRPTTLFAALPLSEPASLAQAGLRGTWPTVLMSSRRNRARC